jgi:hypothetical protein
MAKRTALNQRTFSGLLILLLAASLLSGCFASDTLEPQGSSSNNTSLPSEQVMAEVRFSVQAPSSLGEGQSLHIEFLDEVTGLALNPLKAQMTSQDSLRYEISIPFQVGSVLKYRYVLDGVVIGNEYTSLGQPVRYRLYSVEGPGTVSDVIAGWQFQSAAGTFGRIQGQVANRENNAPVINALVSAGGMQTLTASDGSFLLEGLLPGTHNLVVYSLDGSFRPFQQGAVVAPDSTTPALILLEQAKMVSVTFEVKPPSGNLQGVPVRLIGNIYSLGNTFADLRGGASVIASRAPLMSVLPNGHYSLTLQLPAGLDLQYKYTLGDGFWNAERDQNGEIRTRQLIVPQKDVTVEDQIDTWKTYGFEPVSFTVSVPANTLISDTVSIQFNPFGWTEPIPMWPIGNNRWLFVLYNPLNVFSSASYRYCRNDQCGTADASETRGLTAQGIPFSPGEAAQSLEDTVSSWAWYESQAQPATVSAASISARGSEFQAGVEWLPDYHPSWQPYLVWAMQNLQDMRSNMVMIAPTWRFTHQDPPVVEPVAGKDPLWPDLTRMVGQAQQKGLGLAIHPVLEYPGDAQQWWQDADREDGWWQSWFDRYRTFTLYHADLAAQTGARMLVLGDENLSPALPGGVLADGSPSGVPGDALDRWRRLIAEVRSRYSGKLAWMVSCSGNLSPAPEFVGDLDLLYVRITPPLIEADQPSQPDLEASIAALFDEQILKLQEKTNQPVIIGLQFPSISGAYDGCIDLEGNCLAAGAFEQAAPEFSADALALNEQAVAYNAVLSVVNQRSWIAGFYATGYLPVVEMKDLSTSVRNKPAADVLGYWYPRLLGITQ